MVPARDAVPLLEARHQWESSARVRYATYHRRMAPGTLSSGRRSGISFARATLHGSTQRTWPDFLPVSDPINPSICSVCIVFSVRGQSAEEELPPLRNPGRCAQDIVCESLMLVFIAP